MTTDFIEVLYYLQKHRILKSFQHLESVVFKDKFFLSEAKCYKNSKYIFSYGVSTESNHISNMKAIGEMIERLSDTNNDFMYGISAAIDSESGRLVGIYELIERDAFMKQFMSAKSHTRLNEARIFELLKLSKSKNENKFIYYFFDITNELMVPSYATFILSKDNPQIIGAGIKSNLSNLKALLGSFEEAVLEITLKVNSVFNFDIKEDNLILSKSEWEKIFIQNKCPFKLFKQNSVPFASRKNELQFLLRLLSKAKVKFTTNTIGSDYCKNSRYKLYLSKSLQLQPLIFFKKEKSINMERM